MNEYKGVVVEKANISDIGEIIRIIQSRCKWLDDNCINQWNVTRTYGKQYYEQKINEGKFYIAKLSEKIVRNFYASV
ncbi:MAG: hypothetical protein ACLUF5_04685 [Clostridia bacterium]|jgi:hypothetical protein|nr:acetyltransferase [Clostridium sp. CAG:798]HBJ12887.1 hypothetical protein [Clostridiales bacterium]